MAPKSYVLSYSVIAQITDLHLTETGRSVRFATVYTLVDHALILCAGDKKTDDKDEKEVKGRSA